MLQVICYFFLSGLIDSGRFTTGDEDTLPPAPLPVEAQGTRGGGIGCVAAYALTHCSTVMPRFAKTMLHNM